PEDSGIAALARAVHAQSVSEALEVLRSGRTDVQFAASPKPRELGKPLEREAREHYAALRNGDIEARLNALDHFRVLCAHRSGPGSAVDRVAIVLPERASRLLSRELLYTAITRAKQNVSVYASEPSLRAAITQRSERNTGLVDRLSLRGP